ncbi:MAG: hypothetical protein GX868_12825 [Actinobacteria bacterium]|nr:hypothetical protein [Actinomycetota bacterium]
MSLRADPDSDRLSLPLRDNDVLAFGRGVDCALRFGHAPVRDRALLHVCGWLVVANGRIIVQAADHLRGAVEDPSVIHRPLVVTPDLGQPRYLASGELWGPNAEIFTVTARGEHSWSLDVVNFRDLATDLDGAAQLPSVLHRVELDDELWTVLAAYAEPVRRGERMPATHDQVAAAINWNRMTARRRLERIYDEFYLRRIEMPDVSDMRVKVVEAAMSHGLLGRYPT